MRRCSFGEMISARSEFLSCIEQPRQPDVNNGYDSQRPKPSGHPASLVMPDRGGNDAGESHREHEFPGEFHDLIHPRAWECPAKPDVDEKERGQLREKPDVGRNKLEAADWCVPAAKKQRHGKATNGEHAKIFCHEKRGVFESGVFRHVSGNNFGLALAHIAPSIENLLLLPQPAMKTASSVVEPTAKKNKMPPSIANGVMFRP